MNGHVLVQILLQPEITMQVMAVGLLHVTHWLSVLPLRFLGVSMLEDMPAARLGLIELGRETEWRWLLTACSQTDTNRSKNSVCKQVAQQNSAFKESLEHFRIIL